MRRSDLSRTPLVPAAGHGSWAVLRGGGGRDLALAVDFASVGRREAGFSDLVPQVALDCDWWHTVQPNPGSADGATGPDCVAGWGRDVRADGRAVRAVLGYCAGGIFAAALAEQIGGWQHDWPEIVLFDPAWPSTVKLHDEFDRLIDRLAPMLVTEEIEETRRAGRSAARRRADFGACAGQLVDIVQKTARAAFDRAGLDLELAEELTTTFRSFVTYLAAAEQVDPSAGWARATAICSSAWPSDAVRAEREIRVDVEHAELLRSPQAARAVLDVLSRAGLERT